MDLLDSITTRLIGRPRTNEPVTTPPVDDTETKMIDLQRGVDKLNAQIEGYSKQIMEDEKAAKMFAKQGNRVMAKQKLAQMKRNQKLIETANVNIDRRHQKMMIISESQMIAETHVDIVSANDAIKNLNGKVDIGAMQDALIDDETIENEVNELVEYAKENSSSTLDGNLDAEIDKLMQDDSEEDLNYDYPVVVRQPINTTATSSTMTNNTTIPKSNLFESLL